MSKVHVVKRKDPFVRIGRQLAQDSRVSFALRGLIQYAFSLPGTWEFNMVDLENRSPSGKDALRTIIHEGIKFGYITRFRKRVKGGKLGKYDYYFYDIPVDEPQKVSESYFHKKSDKKPTIAGETYVGLSNVGKPATNKETTKNRNIPPISPPGDDYILPDKSEATLGVPDDAPEKSKANLKAKLLSISMNIFDSFRKKYPGTKRGLEKEFLGFTKSLDKHKIKGKDRLEALQQLMPALEAQKRWRAAMARDKEFVAPWKNLSTWINNCHWTEEPPEKYRKYAVQPPGGETILGEVLMYNDGQTDMKPATWGDFPDVPGWSKVSSQPGFYQSSHSGVINFNEMCNKKMAKSVNFPSALIA